MTGWQRYLKKDKQKEHYYRNFGDLSDDSVVTDIYTKRKRRKQKYGGER